MSKLKNLARRPHIVSISLALILILGSGAFFALTYVQKLPRLASASELHDVKYWKSRVNVAGAAQAYKEAVGSVPVGSSLKVYHEIGHLVGAAIYEEKGLDAIVACDPLTVYGCFHEIVRLYMREHETNDLRPLAQRCDELLGMEMSWMCKHAIGHGLILQNGKTLDALRKSLEQCDTVATLEYMESCHAGVFMEFDYDMSNPGDLEKTRPLDETNTYSPCFDVSGKYFEQCIRRRPYWWIVALEKVPSDERYAYMMQLCRDPRIKGKTRAECINAVALQIVMFEGQTDKVWTRCSEISRTKEELEICSTEIDLAMNTLMPKK